MRVSWRESVARLDKKHSAPLLSSAICFASLLPFLVSGQSALAQPGDTYSPPVLHGLDQNNSASVTEAAPQSQTTSMTTTTTTTTTAGAPQATSPVEAFFQLAPTVQAGPVPAAKPHSGAYRAMWHVMDNIGVPMFGNKDPDIDPALSRPFVMPAIMPDQNTDKANAAANTQTKPPRPTIIDPQAAFQDPSQMAPDDSPSKASSVNKPIPNPQ